MACVGGDEGGYAGRVKTLAAIGLSAALAACGFAQSGSIDERIGALVSPPAPLATTATPAATRASATVAHTYLSTGNRTIQILRVSAAPKDAQVPAILLVAGLDGRHRVGTDAALRVAETLTRTSPAWLAGASVYILPCANPDAFAVPLMTTGKGIGTGTHMEFGRLPMTTDADRDRRQGEDPAEDLNGDGLVTLMRVRDPKPGTGLSATLIDEADADPASPWKGLMRAPDAAKGERAMWAVLSEGIDNDGDGTFNEDGPGPEGYGGGGGLDLDRNFPIHWPEFEDGAGVRPLQTPESLELARWCLATPELAAVVVFGLHDTVISIPEAGKFDASGEVPLGILGEDKTLYEAASARYRDLTGIHGCERPALAGSFAAWSYAALGLPTFATPVWVRSDRMNEDRRPAKPPAAEEPAGDDAKDAKAPRPEPGNEDQKWMRALESAPTFLPWTPFDHPKLGPVEIGGFLPGARINPVPGSETDKALGRLAEEHAAFLGTLAANLATLDTQASAERLGPGMWTIRARITNTGAWPTRTAMSVRARQALPTSVSLGVPPETIVSGNLRQSAERIDPRGGRLDAAWTVLARDGETLTLTVTTPGRGASEIKVELAAPK